MIKLKDVKEAYEELSGKASEVVRQLAFAGIGVVWIFNRSNDTGALNNSCCRNVSNLVGECNDIGFDIPEGLMSALFLLCLAVAIDLLQYTVSTGIWYVIYLIHHKKNVDDETKELPDPEYTNILPWLLWLSKIALTIWAYVLIAKFLFLNK